MAEADWGTRKKYMLGSRVEYRGGRNEENTDNSGLWYIIYGVDDPENGTFSIMRSDFSKQSNPFWEHDGLLLIRGVPHTHLRLRAMNPNPLQSPEDAKKPSKSDANNDTAAAIKAPSPEASRFLQYCRSNKAVEARQALNAAAKAGTLPALLEATDSSLRNCMHLVCMNGCTDVLAVLRNHTSINLSSCKSSFALVIALLL